jgi:succinyl-diaminopimelate desuccinylase
MQDQYKTLLDRVDEQRIAQLALDLVRIPSPSGRESEVAEFYANYLQKLGLTVTFDRSYPESPSVVAKIAGDPSGKTIQFDGHSDTISAEHAPGEIRGGRVYGRGSSDMKGSLAAMAEAARLLVQSGIKLAGNVLFTVHGQHEDAVGNNPMHAPLLALFDKKILGNAAIVCEGPSDGIVIAAKGLTFWEIDINRDGDPLHEVLSGGAPNPIRGAYKVIEALEKDAQGWALHPDPDVGPETYFIGEITSGDYYNRIPTHLHMMGTRRTIPGVSFESMQQEFQALVKRVAEETNLCINLKLLPSGQSYRMPPDEEIVRALQQAYLTLTGQSLTTIGLRYTANASQFNSIAKIPTIYYGPDAVRAHANPEWVEISELVKACKIYTLSALSYLQSSKA